MKKIMHKTRNPAASKPYTRWVAVFSFVLIAIIISVDIVSAQTVSFILSDVGGRIPISLAYEVTQVISIVDDEDARGFHSPTDLTFGPDGTIYVLDAGNNRIVNIDTEGNTLAIFRNFGEYGITGANGIFVDTNGDIYIADTDRQRIVLIDSGGMYVKELVKPESELLDVSTYPFRPYKVVVDKMGRINMLSERDFHGIIVIDSDNEFVGYIGTNKVTFSLGNAIARFFATPEQKEQLARVIPPYFTSIYIDDNGFYYTTTAMTDTQQIKKLSAMGINLFANNQPKNFGERGANTLFVDLTVDANGIVSAIEQYSGNIYQYDEEGNMLCAFGGKGEVRGRFITPVAIDQDSEGNLYVLDKDSNMIQVFGRTGFMREVHNAVGTFYRGEYDTAQEMWREILKSDSTYLLAYNHLGKTLYKQEEWEESMFMYKTGKNKRGYSLSFDEWRRDFLRTWFTPVAAGISVCLFVIFKLIMRWKKRASVIVVQKEVRLK